MNPPREITPEEAKLVSDYFKSEGIVERMVQKGHWKIKEMVKAC